MNATILHASRIFTLPSERDHKANDGPPTPGPNVRISPLTVPPSLKPSARASHSA